MTNVPDTETIGLTVGGRYRMDALIGRGGMASVYRAHDTVLDRDVAVKLFRSDAADADEVRRQQAEVQVLASLNHPGLAMLMDAGVDEQDPGHPKAFVVMQLIDGSDLRSRLRRGPLPPRDVEQLGADLADALHHIHSKGIVHRDVKPANVLLAHTPGSDTRPHPKLADFGIARLVDGTRLTATGVTIGTANYLSPEQARGEHVGPPSDVYSLGLVLLECLTGEQAFPGPAVEAAVARVVSEPVIPESLGERWGTILRAMTSMAPEHRPSAHQVALALREGIPLDVGAVGAETAATARLARTTLETAASGDPVASTVAGSSTATVTKPLPVAQPTSASASDGRADGIHEASGAASGAKRRSRRGWILGCIGVIVVAAAVVWSSMFAPWVHEEEAPPVQYPAVDGDLGVPLQRLQESVER